MSSSRPQRISSAARSEAGDSGRPCARAWPAAAQISPRLKIAPRWVLMPPVARSMRVSASLPNCLRHANGMPATPAMQMRRK